MAEDMEEQVNAIFQPQGKVYCGNCHYYVPSRATPYGITSSLCRHPHARQEYETYEGVVTTRLAPEDRNRHNDCVDWQRCTFWGGIRQSAFKQLMLLLAALFLLAKLWDMVKP
jgi:hypothetical protein